MRKIKVGMIRCDLHGVYYANIMQKHDPLVLRELYHQGYYYFYGNYHDPHKMDFPLVPGFEITRVWDKDTRLAEKMRQIYASHPKVCRTFEEVSDDVDLVIIPDCNGDGSDHLQLAVPAIKKKVPTFIDKPFAYNVKDARKLVTMAERYHTPIMSLSILRELPQATLFRNRFQELNGAKFGVIKGGGFDMAALIHSISLAQHLFGSGVESVEAMGDKGFPFIVHLDYAGKKNRPLRGVVLNGDTYPTWHCAIYASAYSEKGAVYSDHFSDYEFIWGVVEIVKKIKKMALTRKPPTSYSEMVECIAIATAARLSLKKKRRVLLREV
jgi:predicted dehydrogenase